MSNDTSHPDTHATPENPMPVTIEGRAERIVRPARWSTALAVLALLIALGAGAGSYLTWRAQAEARAFATQTSARNTAQLGELDAGLRDLRNQLDGTLGSQIQTLETRQRALRASLQTVQNSLQSLYAAVREKSSSAALFAQTEQLIHTANHRLLLEHDIATARAALSAADQLLRGSDDPQALRIRELLAQDINALSALAAPDISGMAFTLESMANNIEELTPITHAVNTGDSAHATVAADKDWRAVLRNVWSEIKGLVVIRYNDKPAPPLVAPEQAYFLQQNLRLVLESARLSLLRRDTQNFRASLDTARQWIKRYYNIETPLAAGMLETLTRLAQTDINPPMQEITAPLRALQQLRREQERTRPIADPATDSDAATAAPAPDTAGPAVPGATP